MYDTTSIICAVLLLCSSSSGNLRFGDGIGGSFPDEFVFGVATSAYQIEGGWNASGKGESIWDRLTHSRPKVIDDLSNGDVAADSFNLYQDDIQALKYLGVDSYRFSISWPRVLPTGDISSINEEGIKYYSDLIDALLAERIEPAVTLYHWDLPQALQDLGGFTNPLIVDYFEQYAKLMFERFGDRVKLWITFNEPFVQCIGGYVTLGVAPLLFSNGVGEYLCSHHTLIAHARAYHLYQDSFKSKFNGRVGISLNSDYFYAKSNSTEDVKAQNRAQEFMLGWHAHPIYSKEGGYPPIIAEIVGENSKQDGRAWSRLPNMDDNLKKYIQGTADFFGLNHYTSQIASSNLNQQPPYSWETDRKVDLTVDPTWERAASSWLYVVPEGIRKLLNWIKHEYNNPIVYITENGYSDRGGLEDGNRVNYYSGYLNATLQAISVDGCNVQGYFAWSLLDNFEWIKGYTERFGLFDVDYKSPLKTRTPKNSADFYKETIKTRKIPAP